VRAGKLLLVSKHAAPDVFYLPGGKPEHGETSEETLRREIAEELGARVVGSRPLTVVHAPAAIEMLLPLLTTAPAPRC
jgi:8-oxo-dGTP diphosphatase